MSNRLKMAKVHAIIGLLEQGWSYRRIGRELGVDRDTVARYDRLRKNRSKPAIVATGSYSSVKRFVRRLGSTTPLPFRRMECEPGQEGQADFGFGAWVIEENKRRRPHILRITLGHSRKSYRLRDTACKNKNEHGKEKVPKTGGF